MNSNNIYHEKQIRELCLVHALNNLFQSKEEFMKSELDNICKKLSPEQWINPHRSFLGLGNYDVNVLMAALHSKKCSCIWFDKRKDPSCINLSNIIGFILNVPTEYKLGFITLPLRRRHWISIRSLEGQFWNLDSKFDEPVLIGNEEKLYEYIRNQFSSNDKELFVVVSKEIEDDESWINKSK